MIQQLADQQGFAKVVNKLVLMAWLRYRVPRAEAEDVAQTAVATYLEVRHRYVDQPNQHAILIGIFRKKCLEFIDGSARERRKLRSYGRRIETRRRRDRLDPRVAQNGRALRKPQPVLEKIIHEEDVDLILGALGEMRPEARDMLTVLIRGENGRKGLIEKYDLNENTLDSRLRVYRKELRQILLQRGVLER